jgi:hypothetical protein
MESVRVIVVLAVVGAALAVSPTPPVIPTTYNATVRSWVAVRRWQWCGAEPSGVVRCADVRGLSLAPP